MSYFKSRTAQPIRRPMVNKVLAIQLLVTIGVGLLVWIVATNIGVSVLLGGLISIVGQSYFNFRALRKFGTPDTTTVIAGTFQAMWGKWLIIIATSIVAVAKLEELNAGVFFASLFGVHTLGALLLPVLVKREA